MCIQCVQIKPSINVPSRPTYKPAFLNASGIAKNVYERKQFILWNLSYHTAAQAAILSKPEKKNYRDINPVCLFQCCPSINESLFPYLMLDDLVTDVMMDRSFLESLLSRMSLPNLPNFKNSNEMKIKNSHNSADSEKSQFKFYKFIPSSSFRTSTETESGECRASDRALLPCISAFISSGRRSGSILLDCIN